MIFLYRIGNRQKKRYRTISQPTRPIFKTGGATRKCGIVVGADQRGRRGCCCVGARRRLGDGGGVLPWWRSGGALGEGTVVIWCGFAWGEEKKENAMEKRSQLQVEVDGDTN